MANYGSLKKDGVGSEVTQWEGDRRSLKEVGDHLGTNQKEKGPRFPVTPLFDLVAGPGFEPVTFGMVTRRSNYLCGAR